MSEDSTQKRSEERLQTLQASPILHEPPVQPEVIVHTERESQEESLNKILEKLVALNCVPDRLVRRLVKDKPDVRDEQSVSSARPAQWVI